MKPLRIICLILASVTFGLPAFANPGDAKILLTGKALNLEKPQRITVKDLESMFELVTVEAYNPWEKRSDQYTGIWMNQLIDKFAKPGLRSLDFKAIDNYQISFIEQDWTTFKILMATRVNNEYQSVRNKGPMRLIYADYDQSNIEHELNLTKWMWMIKRIEFN